MEPEAYNPRPQRHDRIITRRPKTDHENEGHRHNQKRKASAAGHIPVRDNNSETPEKAKATGAESGNNPA